VSEGGSLPHIFSKILSHDLGQYTSNMGEKQRVLSWCSSLFRSTGLGVIDQDCGPVGGSKVAERTSLGARR